MRSIIVNLISASGYQAHTTSPSASMRVVCAQRRVHRIPRPTFVTIAKRPSSGRGWREVIEMICPTSRAKYFFSQGWTLESALIELEKFDFWRNELLAW
jgi:hypothetical protein